MQPARASRPPLLRIIAALLGALLLTGLAAAWWAGGERPLKRVTVPIEVPREPGA